MKTILLKVEVPDDFDLPVTQVIFEKGNMFFRAEKYITQIQLPTQAEAMKDCDKYYASLEGEKDNADLHYFAGEMNIINKLK